MSTMPSRPAEWMRENGIVNISNAVMAKSVSMSMVNATAMASVGMPIWANKMA